jgi:hypothetical protein
MYNTIVSCATRRHRHMISHLDRFTIPSTIPCLGHLGQPDPSPRRNTMDGYVIVARICQFRSESRWRNVGFPTFIGFVVGCLGEKRW